MAKVAGYLELRRQGFSAVVDVPSSKREAVGAKRLMAGSDYPFRGPRGRCMEFVETSGLPADDIRSILGETAATWFDPSRPPRRAPDQAAATSRTRAAMEPGVGNTLDSSAGL